MLRQSYRTHQCTDEDLSVLWAHLPQFLPNHRKLAKEKKKKKSGTFINLFQLIHDCIIYFIVVSDINGRTIKSFKSVSQNQINISDLSSGVYFLKITTDGGNAIKKIIKE